MLAPAFMADRRHKRVHGVELFNFLLVRRLVELGVRVTLAAEPRWREGFAEHFAGVGQGLEVVYGLPLSRPLPVSLSLVPGLLRRGPYDLVVLGNNGRGVLPAARAVLRWGQKPRARCVLFAHQYAVERYLRALRPMRIEVHCVSEAIAADFRRVRRWPVSVGYGILNADRFYPVPQGGAGVVSRPVRFGVVGTLDAPDKGAHLALEAWERLSDVVRGRAELHLLAFKNPPEVRSAGVVLHNWLPAERMPDFMRSLDVLIVPSVAAESFSQVAVQGMLTGLPMLAYPLPALAEKLDTGGGAVFKTGAELAALVERLVLEPGLRERMGEIARRTALERYCFSAEAFAERFLGPAATAG